MTHDVTTEVKAFILERFLPEEDPGALEERTPLITNGILDSLATLQLVAFLEERFEIEVAAHETGIDYLNTITDIAALVRSKQRP